MNLVTPRLRVLFVCAMNRQRSVTAERLYRNDARLEVRSAGVRFGAERRVSEDDLRWADVVFVMEREHKLWITTRFEQLELPPIEVLDIPDEYVCMDPQLEEILRLTVGPELEAILARHRARKR
ncbi:MAG TPA: protein tyrosine phosphatase [Opitutaceae bacterium]|nr:protein tyrosine phosphatase [Opitutaceae bacterium]